MREYLLILIIVLMFGEVSAQTPPDNLSGSELRTWLKQNWYDGEHNQLGYSEARRKMYGFIDNHNDTITCVYSGFYQINPYGNEITFPNPINTEHTVPQSLFNSNEPMRSDIHAIFPTYLNWNSERGSSPFADITDSNTQIWMRGSNSQGGIPTMNIDEYSESISNNTFEPREDHKGNVARAVFYFYTMYPQVGNITQVADISTLCAWHSADPPNAQELARNDGAAQYQGNRNPYIDMPELAGKAWDCVSVGVTEVEEISDNLLVTPNPFDEYFSLAFSSDSNEKITVRLYDMRGKRVWKKSAIADVGGTFNLRFDTSNLATGNYVLTLIQGTNIYHKKLVK